MKKQVISLMLSASILSVSPLFAMEDPSDPNEPPHKTAIKKTSPIDDSEELDKIVESLNASLREGKLLQRIHNNSLTEDEKINGTGNFQRFNQKLILNVLEHLPVNDVLKMFQLSKAMYKICDQDAVWKLLAKKHDACISTIRFRHPKDIKTGLREWLDLRKHNMTYAYVNSWKHC